VANEGASVHGEDADRDDDAGTMDIVDRDINVLRFVIRPLDQLAKDKRQIEKDADAHLDQEVEAALRGERQDWEDRLDTLRTQRRDALARAQEAESALTAMVTELVGGVDQRAVYLFSGGQGVRSLDKAAVNRVLAKAGVVLKSKATASERTVAVTIEPGHVVGHHLFWLAKVPAAGVVDAAAAEALDEGPPAPR
jgi:hypothetical protein